MGTVHGLMTSSRPACPLIDKPSVVAIANHDHAWGGLSLEMTFQAKVGVALNEHLLVGSTVRIMAGRASFAHRFMLKNKRSALRGVTLHAGVAFGRERSPAALDGRPFVRIMAITAGHFAIFNWMMMCRAETRFHVQMAGHARFRIAFRINDRVARPTALRVNASGSVTRFTTHLLGVGTLRRQARVIRGVEVFIDVCVAFRAILASHERRAFNVRRYHNRPLHIRAGDQRGDRGYPKQAKQHGPFRDRSPRWWIG